MSGKIIILTAVLIIIFSGLRIAGLRSISNGQEGIISGVISEEPTRQGTYQKFKLNGVLVTTSKYPEYHYGDYLKIFRQKGAGDTINNIYYPKIVLIDRNKGNMVLGWIYKLRQRVVEIYQSFLPGREAGLLSGIVLGVKSDLISEFNNDLKNTGTMHVVVASGMNITYIAGFLILLFKRFFNRRLAISLSFFGIFFYMALAGFQAPIIRAGIMGMISYTGQVLGKQKWGFLSLVVTVIMMLFINPFYVTDVGFQLSVAATAGLLLIQPLLTRIMIINKIIKIPMVGDSLATSISAQLAVLPILLTSFGTVSVLSPFINSLILWVVPWVMILGAIIAILGLIIMPLAHLVAYICYGFLFFFCETVSFFGKSGGGIVRINNLSVFFGIGYYLILFSIILGAGLRKRNKDVNNSMRPQQIKTS